MQIDPFLFTYTQYSIIYDFEIILNVKSEIKRIT